LLAAGRFWRWPPKPTSARELSSSVHCDLQPDDKPAPTCGSLDSCVAGPTPTGPGVIHEPETKDWDWCVLREDFGIDLLQAITTKGLDRCALADAKLGGEGRAAPRHQQGRVQDADADPDGIRAIQPQGMLFYVARMSPIFCDAGPYAIIMAPSRDLAQQIERDMGKF
jgi:hypothetical protein